MRRLSLLKVEELEGKGCTDVKDDVPAAQDENHEAQQLVLEPKIIIYPGGNALRIGHTLHHDHIIVVVCAEKARTSVPLRVTLQTWAPWWCPA